MGKKGVLLGMMAPYTRADVIVVGLIGERGREVKEFVEDILGAKIAAARWSWPRRPMRRRCCACRARLCHGDCRAFPRPGLACAAARGFADPLRHGAARIALAIGEPPATKGYPPSCFAKLPALVERSGNGLNGVGSITAFYTVLSEGDDQQDPIADAARAILDGHCRALARALAEGPLPGHDIEQSASRVMHNVVQSASISTWRAASAPSTRATRRAAT